MFTVWKVYADGEFVGCLFDRRYHDNNALDYAKQVFGPWFKGKSITIAWNLQEN